MNLFFQQHFQDGGTIPGGGCPTITLGDLTGNTIFYNTAGSYLAESTITGGAAEYTLEVTAGSLPPNSTLLASGGVWGIINTGSTLGNYTFTIGGTDANGCPITPREYTIEVHSEFTASITPFAFSNSSIALFSISGMPDTLGTNVEIVTVDYNVEIPIGFSLATTVCQFYDLNDTAFLTWWNEGQLAGQLMTNTVMTPDSATLLTSSSSPYTGNFSDNQIDGGFSALNGVDPNQGFIISMSSTESIDSGGYTSAKIIFRAI